MPRSFVPRHLILRLIRQVVGTVSSLRTHHPQPMQPQALRTDLVV